MITFFPLVLKPKLGNEENSPPRHQGRQGSPSKAFCNVIFLGYYPHPNPLPSKEGEFLGQNIGKVIAGHDTGLGDRFARGACLGGRQWGTGCRLEKLGMVFPQPGTEEGLSKFSFVKKGHSERSEESRIYNRLRSFTLFRMTEKPFLEEPQKTDLIPGPLGA